MRRLKLGFDMDEVLEDLVYQAIIAYNAAYRQELKYYKIEQYDIRPYLVPQCKNIWREFCNDEFFRMLHVEPTAVKTLNYLSQYHDINIVTAGHKETERARKQWLTSHFNFFKPEMLIMESEKQKWDGDMLVDDYEANLIGGAYVGVLMNRPWNRHVDEMRYGLTRITKVSDVLDIVARLERS